LIFPTDENIFISYTTITSRMPKNKRAFSSPSLSQSKKSKTENMVFIKDNISYTETQLRELDVDTFNKLTSLNNVCKWFVDEAYSSQEYNDGLMV
jgi:hypothetical protein